VGSAAQAEEPCDATAARNAYQGILEDGKQASGDISTEDHKTMEEFKAILQEVRQLMDKAMRELRARAGRQARAPIRLRQRPAPLPYQPASRFDLAGSGKRSKVALSR
jgi:hypothetical protein